MNTERKLVTIQQIADLQPIPGADAIEVATVLGWKVVVKKGEFVVGDKCYYFEVDSFLPVKPEYEFLRKGCFKKNGDGSEGFRLRTIKLKGQISQGLCLPYKGDEPLGTDMTEALEVTKWEPPIPIALAGDVEGPFPSYIPKTDEIRLQSIPEILNELPTVEWVATEKIDGTSCTFFINQEGVFGTCSRNWWLRETEGNTYWQVARSLKIEEKLRKLNQSMAIQGEIAGPGIQGNPLKLPRVMFFVFGAFDINEGKYLSRRELQNLTEELELTIVPLIDLSIEKYTVDEFLDAVSNASSAVNPECDPEGVVIRTLDYYKSEVLGGMLSFKVISNKLLLAEK